jgi:hypothetical protein
MQLTKNIIQFRKGFINLPQQSKEDNSLLAMSVVSELMQLGYILSPEAITHLGKSSKEDISLFHNEVINYINDLIGNTRNYKPFWKGFPQEVMDKSEFELFLHQIVHYMSNGMYLPLEDKKYSKKRAFEQSTYTKISVGTDENYFSIFTDLVSLNNSLTVEDTSILEYFISKEKNLIFPEKIPFKETLCLLASFKLECLKPYIKTVTDVLRIATYLCKGDITLASNTKFRKITRSNRKYLLSLLESTNLDATEAVLKLHKWLRLGESLHPGEYKNQFPKSFEFFNQLRNSKVRSWYGKVNESFKKSKQLGLEVLSERPGEYVRRLDYLIRNSSNEKEAFQIVDKLTPFVKTISGKVLVETLNHFNGRNSSKERKIYIKGKRTPVTLPTLQPIDDKVLNKTKTSIQDLLFFKYSNLPSLGKVYLDENLKKIPMPTNMRSLNPALKPTIRGSRLPIGNQNAKVIRAYVHWFDEHGNIDLDLSTTFVGKNKIDFLSYNTHTKAEFGCHSGDVRHVQGSCAEYIDIDIKKSLSLGFEYVLMSVNSFNHTPLRDIKDCVFGYMEREFPESNRTFKPSTLANCTKLTSAAMNTYIAIIDLKTQEYIFLDVDSNEVPIATYQVSSVQNLINFYSKEPDFSVYNLLEIHAQSRGSITQNIDESDNKFLFENFSNSYEILISFIDPV